MGCLNGGNNCFITHSLNSLNDKHERLVFKDNKVKISFLYSCWNSWCVTPHSLASKTGKQMFNIQLPHFKSEDFLCKMWVQMFIILKHKYTKKCSAKSFSLSNGKQVWLMKKRQHQDRSCYWNEWNPQPVWNLLLMFAEMYICKNCHPSLPLGAQQKPSKSPDRSRGQGKVRRRRRGRKMAEERMGKNHPPPPLDQGLRHLK